VPGISITESLHGNQIIETVLREFPEVSSVFSRTGSPEVATDPMAIDQSDVYVTLKPADQWPMKRSKNDLIAAMKKRLEEEAPGAVYSFSQPIQMRMTELMEGGSRSDVAIKLFGDDMDVLRQKADQIAAVVSKVSGAADVRAERVAGLPYLRIHLRRDALARHGLDASDVLDTIEAIGGKPAGEIVEGNRRFTMQVRFPEDQRASAEAIGNLRVGDVKDTSFRWGNSPTFKMRKARPRSAAKEDSVASAWRSTSVAATWQACCRRSESGFSQSGYPE
jgi:cobalt-zinc-cadmium resistance protein CzcA